MTKRISWLVAIVAIALLSLAFSWATGGSSGVDEEGVQVGRETELSKAVAEQDSVGLGESGASAERTQVGSSDAEDKKERKDTQGSITVRVFWDDGKPAENVALWCAGRYPNRLPGGPRQKISNAEGVVRFLDLPAGKVNLRSGREGSKKVDVLAGVDTEVRFEIPVGVDIQGTVTLQNGDPIQGADIWLASRYLDWRGGRFVARSAKDGSFAIRSVRKGASIGAIAANYQRSKLVDLDTLDKARSPVEVRLILEPGGGTLLVHVLDPARKPVEGARVAVGKMPGNHNTHAGKIEEVWTPLLATCDSQGKARLHGLLPGEQDLSVRADGFPTWKGTARIEAHVPAQHLVVLDKPVIVEGIVKDDEQKPVVGAILRATPETFNEVYLQTGQFDYKAVFGYPITRSDSQGRYRLEGIAPGTVHLYAIEKGRLGGTPTTLVSAKKTLKARAGSKLRWDPVLSAGHTIRGLVTFRDGKPMKLVFVTAREQATGKRHAIATDKEGRFRFVNLEAVKHTISGQIWSAPPGTPPLIKKDVWPDQGELRLVASYDSPVQSPPGSVSGRVSDLHGRFSEGAKLNVTLHSDRGWFMLNPKITEMNFRFDKVKPGRYRLNAKAGDTTVAVSDWFEVQARQDLDVGTLTTTPAGSLQVTLLRSKGTESIEPRLHLSRKDKRYGHPTRLERGESTRIQNISVGAYTFTLYAKGIATQRGEVEIQSGQEATLQIRMIPAVLRKIVIRIPASDAGKLEVMILDASGKQIWSRRAMDTSKLAGFFKRGVSLPLGSFSLSAQMDAGAKGSRQFLMKVLDANQDPVELEIR